jgi:hypothetical protein
MREAYPVFLAMVAGWLTETLAPSSCNSATSMEGKVENMCRIPWHTADLPRVFVLWLGEEKLERKKNGEEEEPI